MSTTAISSSTASTNASSSSSSAVNFSKSLTQQDFLSLLVKQMTSQDPMNPQSNTDFAAQMAQFSALQTSQTTESDITKLLTSQQATQANSLLGQTVVLQVDKTTTAQGVVSAVDLSAGTPQLVVNGTNYNLSQVITVTPTPIQ
jgi:flagellar basal-body rod modification protein FlgD